MTHTGMVPRYMINKDCVVAYEKNNDEYQMQGKYQSETDEAVCIVGTVGDNIGRRIYIPKSRVISIDFNKKASREDDDTWGGV